MSLSRDGNITGLFPFPEILGLLKKESSALSSDRKRQVVYCREEYN